MVALIPNGDTVISEVNPLLGVNLVASKHVAIFDVGRSR